MKIYLRIHKDLGQYVVHLWSKHIKEQIIETVNAMCDYSEGYIGYGDYFPTFWQEDIHARCINVGRPSSRKDGSFLPCMCSASYGRKPTLTLRMTTISCAMRQSCRMTSPISRESTNSTPTTYISVRTSKGRKNRLPSPDSSLTRNMLRMVKCWLTVCL